ncbi:hypothetical protein Lfu02_72220 [Longispora fulva]|nr:hypothetical protein Lfu02_72220 [Longispora fulva]
MQDAVRAYLELALGLTEASKKKAAKIAKKLVAESGAKAGHAQSVAEELITTSLANREAVGKLVRYELDRALGRVGLATAEEVAELTDRVQELERKLRAATAGSSAPAASVAPVAAPVVASAANGAVAKAAPVVKKAAAAKKAPAVKKAATAKKAPVAKKAPAASSAPVAAVAAAVKAAPEKATPVKKVAKKTVAKKAAPADV